jgi:hypothetical protein
VEEELYSFFNLSARQGQVVNATPWPLYPHEKNLVSFVQEARWSPELIWTGVENLTPTRFRSPDRPDCSESLYKLSYPGLLIITQYDSEFTLKPFHILYEKVQPKIKKIT